MKKRGGKIFHLLWILFLAAGFFVCPKTVFAENSIIISEIMYYFSSNKDWIEIYNPTSEKITITKEKFGLIDEKDMKLGEDGLHYLNCHKIDKNIEIDPNDFVIIAENEVEFKNDYPNVTSKIVDSTFDLARDDFIRLSDNRCATFFMELSYKDSWGRENDKSSLEKINYNDDNSESNWQESYVDGGTPGKENSKKPAPKIYSSGIRINEILPNPKGDEAENEFIELYNYSPEDIDLENWQLKDASTKKYILPKGEVIKAGEYLAIYRKSFKFAINNSDESIYLLDPNEKSVSEVSFSDSAKENISYAYDTESSAWRWTSKKTPGAKNEFDKILSGKIKKDDPVYVGIYADFSVDADADTEKFTWDFGDGHKSYLKKTKHKYEKTGEYDGNLKISGNGEASQYFFTVKVEKYKAPKIRIASFSPNPKGVDTKKEWIEIENKSKKKINLNGWSIAMGWDNLVNHPIREDFILKSGKSKKLTRKICAFTLNNTKTKIELRDPSGKIVQKIKYDRTSNKIEEDEIYQKTENGWQWIDSQSSTEDTKNNTEETVNNTAEIQTDAGETQTSTDEVPTDASEMQNNTEENAVNNVIQTDDIEENPQVLGAEIVKNSESIETLNIKSNNSNFGKQRLLSSLIWSLNQKINTLMNFAINYFPVPLKFYKV